jgi:hypothetical protein
MIFSLARLPEQAYRQPAGLVAVAVAAIDTVQ